MPRHVDPLIAELKKIRRARKITQAKLAKKIGTNRETLCGWETGAASPSLYWVRKWVNALDLPNALRALPDAEQEPARA